MLGSGLLERAAGTGLARTGKRLYLEAKEDDVSGAAAELAFRLFVAVFPFFIFIAALGSTVAGFVGVEDPTQEIMDAFGDSLPEDTASVLRTQLEGVLSEQDPRLLSLGVAGAIWAAMGGIGTIIKAGNKAYGVRESRPWVERMALAVALTVFGGLLLVAAFILFVIGQFYGLQLANELGFEGTAARLMAYSRWPGVIVLSLAGTAVLYRLAPNTRLPFRWITPGALLFVAGWLLVTYVFSLYVSSFGSYNATYGALGGVVITLTWFYLTSLILLLGQELNAVLAQQAGVGATAAVPEEKPPEVPAAGVTAPRT